jgi:hypothetical protein
MVGGGGGASDIQLSLQPDMRVLLFTLGLTATTALLFGLVPSLHVTRVNLSPVLRSTNGFLGSWGAGGCRLGNYWW